MDELQPDVTPRVTLPVAQVTGAGPNSGSDNQVHQAVLLAANRLRQPSIADPWVLFGDMVMLSTVAPAIGIFFARSQVYMPQWFALAADTEQGFVFPEVAHCLMFAACWLLGGLAGGAFESLAVDPKNLATTLRRTWAGGACATALASFVWLCLWLTGTLLPAYASVGYVTQANILPSPLDILVDFQLGVASLVVWRFSRAVSMASADTTPVQESQPHGNSGTSIGDPRLFVGDMVASGAIVPALLVIAFVQTGTYIPEWFEFWAAQGGSAAEAALSHGSLLAICWLLGAAGTGALSAEAAEEHDLGGVLKRTWTAGLVATLLLAIATAFSVYLTVPTGHFLTEYDAERRLAHTLFDLLLDVQFEATCLTLWRLAWAGYFF